MKNYIQHEEEELLTADTSDVDGYVLVSSAELLDYMSVVIRPATHGKVLRLGPPVWRSLIVIRSRLPLRV